jgi:hypothetical protein
MAVVHVSSNKLRRFAPGPSARRRTRWSVLLSLIARLQVPYGIAQPTALEWFLQLFYLNLLVSHLPIEDPYRSLSG